MRMPFATTLSHDLPQSNQASMTGTSDNTCEDRSTMSSASSGNLDTSLNITLAQDWLACVQEGEAKDHARMMLPDIISRYRKRSETAQNHGYYMDHFGLSQEQVCEALQCLEDTGILTRLTFCNLMTAGDRPFEILNLSNEFRDLIRTQGSKQSQDITQGEIQ